MAFLVHFKLLLTVLSSRYPSWASSSLTCHGVEEVAIRARAAGFRN